MDWSDDILDKVRSFGILGYSVDKIIDLVSPPDVYAFRNDFADVNSSLHKAYRKGRTRGSYNLDKELFEQSTHGHSLVANSMLSTRLKENKIDDAIFEEFGF